MVYYLMILYQQKNQINNNKNRNLLKYNKIHTAMYNN